jgi:tellurite resistance protein TerC
VPSSFAVGAAALQAFSVAFLLFGVALLATAAQLFRHRDTDPQIDDNKIVALARRLLPITATYDDGRIVSHRDGRRALTPLFLALLAIGTSDVLFAFDSIPAVFGVTEHGYIVFTANAFALLGLRPLFFLVAGLLDRLVYLSTGLSVILAFIGLKLILEFAHTQDAAVPQISTAASLAVIVTALLVTTAASAIAVRRDPRRQAHAGSLGAAGLPPTPNVQVTHGVRALPAARPLPPGEVDSGRSARSNSRDGSGVRSARGGASAMTEHSIGTHGK